MQNGGEDNAGPDGSVGLKIPVSICSRYFADMDISQITETLTLALDAWFMEKGKDC